MRSTSTPPSSTRWAGRAVPRASAWKTSRSTRPTTPTATRGSRPGPISNPGKAALNACVTPLQRDQKYIFYFADCAGHTHFAHTNGEFDALKRQYGVVGDGC